MIKAVIFDLDGVLVSTDRLHTKAWREASERFHIPFDDGIADLLRGVSRSDSADIILKKGQISLSEQQKTLFTDKKNQIYINLLETLSSQDVLSGVPDLLDYLEQKKIPVAVASSSQNAIRILKQVELFRRFFVIIDGNQISRSKPDPEVFQKAVKALGLQPEECLVVEDALSGVTAAKSIGCHVAGIGLCKYADCMDYSIDNMKELITCIEQSGKEGEIIC